MEFRYRSGDQRAPSSSFSFSASSYFSDQALRVGIVPSTLSRTEAIIEELRKERIREEILAREITRKRMLEEELLRELEHERRIEMRGFENEGFFPLEMESRVRERLEPRYMDRYVEIREKERSPCYRDIKMDGIERSVGAFEKPLASRRAIVEKLGIHKVPLKSKASGSKDKKLPHQKVSGIKRKAAIELPQLARKEWTCSLCHVTATSQKNLNVHRRGKKHKAKEAQLTNNKVASNNSNASSSFQKDSNSPLVQIKGMEGKMLEHKKNKPCTVWCDLCKVRCNSLVMLDRHLNGKRHKKAQMESMKGGGAGDATMPTSEVVKEVTDQKEEQEEQEELKPEEDDAKANGEDASNKTLDSSW